MIVINPTQWDRVHEPVPSPLLALYAFTGSQQTLVEAGHIVARALGFDSFLFGMTTAETLSRAARIHWCSSAPREWCEEYDRESYVEVDPRAAHAFSSLTPTIWDRSLAGSDQAAKAFFERAAVHGVRSGVCIPVRDNGASRVLMSLNSSNNEADRDGWTANMGTYLLFAIHFYNIFLREVIKKNLPPSHRGRRLSSREIECLTLAAKGQTSADIGFKLDIAERTVNFHFSNIVSKLDAANRIEAIAIGVSRGIVQI